MKIKGADFAASLSDLMIEWIKDTSILWIKNMGQQDLTQETELTINEEHHRNAQKKKGMHQEKKIKSLEEALKKKELEIQEIKKQKELELKEMKRQVNEAK